MAVLLWCPFFVSRQTYGKNEFPTQLKSNPMQDFVEYEYVTKAFAPLFIEHYVSLLKHKPCICFSQFCNYPNYLNDAMKIL